jgi:pSer/pThr/pTyr-binding forkhead associated (FHA) protein
LTNSGVSRQHLLVSVPATMDGDWIVRDLDSVNGTFVREDDGSFRQIHGEVHLRWDSVVRMGPANVLGYTFWLCQLLQTDPKDFSLQFRRLNMLLDEFHAEKQQMDEDAKKQQKKSIYRRAGLSIAMLPLRIGGMAVAGAVSQLMDMNKEKPKMSRDYKLFMRCPNGACGKPLAEHDIRNGQCPYCKAHI